MARYRMDLALRLRSLAATVGILAALSLVTASPALAVPGNFWGVVPQTTPTADQYERLKRGGVDSIRTPLVWAMAQPTKGAAFDWSASDAIIGGAVRARLDVLPFLSGAPTWAVPADRRLHSPKTLPVRTGAQKSAWRTFVRAAVFRYGPRGSFWTENPDLPRRPIRTWQVWNEPNFRFFVANPNPAEYGKLVVLSHAALRSADAGAKLLLGGLFSHPGGERFPASKFLDLMYKRTPGIKSKFDGVALHPYTATYKRIKPYTEEFLAVLKRHKDQGKGLWITELGWSSQKPTRGNSFAKGSAGQVRELKGSFRVLEQNQRKWKLQRLYWFSVDDELGACNFCDGSGLFDEGFVPKPSWKAFVGFAGGRP